jgi:outer membrane protein
MKITKIVIALTVLLMAVQAVSAQKIGHLNSGNILALMPDAAKADSGLVIYRNELVAKGDSAGKAFEKEYKAFVEAYNAGTLAQIQIQKKQEELQNAQKVLQNYAQEIDQRIANLRRQLLQPILVKLDEAVHAVGKEGGYQAIFDSSTGSTLFAQESDDVSAQVKAKLGLK